MSDKQRLELLDNPVETEGQPLLYTNFLISLILMMNSLPWSLQYYRSTNGPAATIDDAQPWWGRFI
jgi:hypothetical protein